MTALADVLHAGGMVPATAQLDRSQPVDTVVARAYTHPVLPGRTVVRLAAQSVVQGDELEMSTLGFDAGEDRGAVGKERRRPLGFPGWALVNDPKNARYALDVVKELKKHARRAKSKPGFAKEGIDAIAETLGKSVPHFLPSFFEEAGRVFVEHGAPSYAAQMFGKAREAEAVHSLAIDEEHRVHGFLEFALAGAVTTKALSAYAKDLAAHHEPAVAYAHFRQLCVQRTLGGMPPWSGMAKELRRLAKAAKKDPDAEDAALVEAIIESPALGKAAGELWRAYAAPIVALGQAKPAARGALLNLFPTGAGTAVNAELDDTWLELVEGSGGFAALVDDGAPPEAQPTGGRAAWFDKLTQHVERHYRQPVRSVHPPALLRRMAPRLIADGTPIACLGRWRRLDLDLCELALELGVPVAAPGEHDRFDLGDWAAHAGEPERGRDPVRVAAHPTLGPRLAQGVQQALGHAAFDHASHGKPGFLAAKRAVVAAMLDRAERAALPGLEDLLELVKTKLTAGTFAELPDLHARFAAIDLAPALQRTLQIGLLAELAWPLLETVAAELDPDGKHPPALHGGLPATVVASRTKLVAIGAAGRLGEHDLVLPPKHVLHTARFIGGQFLVVLAESYHLVAYWSSAPQDRFELEGSTWSTPAVPDRTALLPDGAWLEAGKPIRVGSRAPAFGKSLVAYDGATGWIQEHRDGKTVLRELAPSGDLGRASWPPFFEAGIEAPWAIEIAKSMLVPDAGYHASPLGAANGLVGARVRVRPGTAEAPGARYEVATVDGRHWAGAPELAGSALLQLPTGETRVVNDGIGSRDTVSIMTVEGVRGSLPSDERYRAGIPTAIPVALWHALVPRDVAGSQRLRAATVADAVALAAGGPEQTALAPALLPEVTDARLRRSIAGVAALAAQLAAQRAQLVTDRAPGAAPPVAPAGPDDAALVAALAGWVSEYTRTQGRAWAQIARVGEVFRGENRADRQLQLVAHTSIEWMGFAATPWLLAFLATAHLVAPAQRAVLLDLLEHLAAALPEAGSLRLYPASRSVRAGQAPLHPAEVRWHGGNAYFLQREGYSGTRVLVLEYAPAGDFKPLPDFELGTAAVLRGFPSAAERAALRAADGSSWSEAAVARLAAATGLTPSEASYLLAGAGERALDKAARELLDLKAAQAALARESMQGVPSEVRAAVVDAAARAAGVAGLTDGAFVDRLAEAWIARVGKRIPVPEAVIAAADKEVHEHMKPAAALAMIGAGAGSPLLGTDGIWAFDAACDPIRVSKPAPLVGQTALADAPPAFDLTVLRTVVVYIPFLFGELPVGDPLRAQAAVAYDLLHARLRNPALWFKAGNAYFHDDEMADVLRVLDGLGGDTIAAGLDDGRTAQRVPGALVERGKSWLDLNLHPAGIDAASAPMIAQLSALMPSWGFTAVEALAYAQSPGLAALAARIRETPVPAGGWEQDPLQSAPALVKRVAAKLAVSAEAAALYLQFLVLLWPTPKRLALWNGWTPKQLAAATAELVAGKLLLEAKRERAQRTVFLPGGWEALDSPHPPMESWKVSLYGTRAPTGDPIAPLQRFVAMEPFHALFERAWKRIEAGDIPKYEDVKR